MSENTDNRLVVRGPFEPYGDEDASAAFEITAQVRREGEHGDDQVIITATDEEGRHVDITVNFFDETVAATWIFPPGMQHEYAHE